MGILSNIFAKIFPYSHAANSPASASGSASTTPSAGTATAPGSAPPTTGTPSSPAPVAISEVDVEALLNDLASKSSEKLNWKTSIVDLMKLLGLDSSLAARKELAKELNYSGDTNDSASMNVWLHKQVMTKVATNGGKVPADLRD